MTGPGQEERHASWLELFFDLVVVVAVSQLAHLLHGEPNAIRITTFFTLYLAIWLLWTTFTLYSNVAADTVRTRPMLMGMAAIATMAAAVPHSMDGRAALFAAAYLTANGIGTGAFSTSGRVLLSWSAASRNAGLVPWVVAFWVDDPWGVLALWLLGLAITVVVSVRTGRADHDAVLARWNASRRSAVTEARLDPAHLRERLGLFVIIVLGEAMLQLVTAVSEIDDWQPGNGHGWLLLLTAAAAFLLLVTLWGLNVNHGIAERTRFPPALVLPAHFVTVAATTTVAAGLGTAATGYDRHLGPSTAWLMCGGLAAFLLVVNLLVAHTVRWPVRVLAVLAPLAAAGAAPWLPAAAVVAVLAVAAGAQLLTLSAIRSAE